MIVKRETAWGVHLGLTDFDKRLLKAGRSQFRGHGLLGGHGINVGGLWCHEKKIALCPTRAEARTRAFVCRGTWPKAKAVKVKIALSYVV